MLSIYCPYCNEMRDEEDMAKKLVELMVPRFDPHGPHHPQTRTAAP